MPELSEEQGRAFIIIAILIALSGGYAVYSIQKKPDSVTRQSFALEHSGDIVPEVKKEVNKPVIVYVCGEVREPGVYRLSPGSMVYGAVEAAGGITEKGDISRINMAKMVKNEDMISIPALAEPRQAQERNPLPESCPDKDSCPILPSSGQININSATQEELERLPGIGARNAEKIIQYRDQNGPFSHTDELKAIPGIKERTFQKLETLVTI